MSDRDGYRQRVTTVRGRARAQLSAMRKERLARKRHAKVPEPGPERWLIADHPHTGHVGEAPSERQDQPVPGDLAPHVEVEARDRDISEPCRDHPALAPEDHLPAGSEPPNASATAVAAEDGDDRTADHIGCAEASGRSDPEIQDTSPAPGDPDVSAAEDALDSGLDEANGRTSDPDVSEPLPAARTDLYDIPGIGSGLVWLLQCEGVASLADLALSDARELGRRLGAVSRLLDLEELVAFARARTGPVEATGTDDI
jgi:predicted flap endonuclease-1-like 5' DNA nuclease